MDCPKFCSIGKVCFLVKLSVCKILFYLSFMILRNITSAFPFLHAILPMKLIINTNYCLCFSKCTKIVHIFQISRSTNMTGNRKTFKCFWTFGNKSCQTKENIIRLVMAAYQFYYFLRISSNSFLQLTKKKHKKYCK